MEEPWVCIFGVDEKGDAIRPTLPLPKRISEDYAKENNIRPFNEIEFDLTPQDRVKAPHLEDWLLNQEYKPKFIRKLSLDEQGDFLEKIRDKSVRDIFGAEIHDCKYVNEGEGNRSLGTIKAEDIKFVDYSLNEYKSFDYRMIFLNQGESYDLSITDLRFRNYCDYLRIHERKEFVIISGSILHELINSVVFFRIGLARPFAKKQNRCYLQISGVYAFPDYM
ncbi:MAG: hypothetical protein KKA79_02180 [Nanoarchaeota archaeon]|nr:hypothetical protein [Nanoarchaeota archaeon]